MKKTNAARLLDSKSIQYDLVEYEVDETDLSATTLAKKIGEDIEQIFKTLVLRGDKTGVFVCVIPGNAEVDLKKAAKVSGNKNCAMVQQKELLPLTGYIRGVFTHRDEETISYFHPRNLHFVRYNFCKRRSARVAVQNQP